MTPPEQEGLEEFVFTWYLNNLNLDGPAMRSALAQAVDARARKEILEKVEKMIPDHKPTYEKDGPYFKTTGGHTKGFRKDCPRCQFEKLKEDLK